MMAHHTNNGAASAAPTRRALLGGAGIIAVMAAAPAIAAAARPASQIEAYPFDNAAELNVALGFAEERGAGHAVLLPLLTAGVRRLAGEVRA